MKKIVMSIADYDPSVAYCTIEGSSMTVPNEATSLKDLVRRAMANMTLPEVANSLEYGEDEDFDDAFDIDQDLVDYADNKSYIERLSSAIEKAKAENAKKREIKAERVKEEQNPIENPDNV